MTITIMFIVCAALLLWIIIGAKGWWWLKLPVIALTFYFGLAVWYSVDSYLGWPSVHNPPRRFMVNWVIVDEPRKGTNETGGIYLLLTKLPHPDDEKDKNKLEDCFKTLGYTGTKKAPRLFKVPYSRPLHKQMEKAKGMIRQGKIVIGEFDPSKGKFGGKGDGEGEGKGRPGQGKPGEGEEGEGKGYMGDNEGLGHFKFYQLPPPKFPNKT
jgi:hypothetical protein